MFCKIITFLSTYSQRCWASTWSKAPIFTACVQTPPDLLFSTPSWVNIQRPAFVHCSRGEKLICVIMMAWSHINIFHAFNWVHLSLLSPEWKQDETRVRGIGPEARANLQTVAKGRLLLSRSICLSGTFPRQSEDQNDLFMAIMRCHILQSQRNKFQTCRTHIPSAPLRQPVNAAVLMRRSKRAARALRLSASSSLPA